MASAMGPLLLFLLAFLSASKYVHCQFCLGSPSLCTVTYGSSITCRNSVCFSCPNTAGGYVTIPDNNGNCFIACNGPNKANHDFCKDHGRDYCFDATAVQLKTYAGDLLTFAGRCGTCDSGYVINYANDGCMRAETSSSPPPFRGSTSGSPPPSPEKSAGTDSPTPPTAPSSSEEPKKKKELPMFWIKLLGITIPGAILCGLIGLLYYCWQARLPLAIERRKFPLADALRSELKLKVVDDFKGTLGLQYCTSIDILSEALRTHGYIKPPALLRQDTRYLAAAMAAVLKPRYLKGFTSTQKRFLSRFANDCNNATSLASLVSEIEDKIRANEGWSHRLASAPGGSFSSQPSIPPPTNIPLGIPASHMKPPPPPQPHPWKPSAPPFEPNPSPFTPYTQNYQ